MRRKRRIPIENGDDDTAAERAAEAEPEFAEEEAEVEAEVEELPADTVEGRVEQLEADLREARDEHLRAVADLQNFRRRAREEKQDAIRYGRETVLETILPVLDNFERALSAARESREFDGLIEGVELIQKQLHDVLTQCGVHPIEAVGQTFDPHLHDAVGRVETDEHPEGTIVEEALKGYARGDAVLRHSRVIVAAPPAAEPKD